MTTPTTETDPRLAVLRELDGQLRASLPGYSRGFLEGRAFQLTQGMDEHPEWWEHCCGCDSCMSYGG
jgi:hypothetical protein